MTDSSELTGIGLILAIVGFPRSPQFPRMRHLGCCFRGWIAVSISRIMRRNISTWPTYPQANC